MPRQGFHARALVTVALGLAFAGAVAAQDVPTLIHRETNPVPYQGEERGALPFMFAQVAEFGRTPYLFVGRGNRYDIYNLSNPTAPAEVAMLTGRVPLTESADWDFHMRALAVVDDDPHVFAPYYDLGGASQILSPSAAPTVGTTVNTYPTTGMVSKVYQFASNAAMFKDAAEKRYVIGAFLTGWDALPLGVYQFADNGTVTRLKNLFPAGLDDTAANAQRFMTFKAPVSGVLGGGSTWRALVPSTKTAGGFWLFDLSNVDALSPVTIGPPAGYTSLLAYAYDPVNSLLAAAYSNGAQTLVKVFGFDGGLHSVASGVLPGVSSDSRMGLGIRGGVVAASASVGSTLRTTLLATVPTSTTSTLIWQRFAELDTTLPPSFGDYNIFWDQTCVFPAGTDVVLYRAGVDASEFWKIPRSLIDPSPHADFTVTDTTSSGATCGTGAADFAANGFPGDSFVIHNTSSGTVASATYQIDYVPDPLNPATVVNVVAETTLPLEPTGTEPGITWSTRAAASNALFAPGEYRITVKASDSANILSDTTSKSVWLCDESVALTANPVDPAVLVGEKVTFTAAATGSPSGDGMPKLTVKEPDGSLSGTTSGTTLDLTPTQCGTYTVGVVATYAHAGTDSGCSASVPGYADDPALYQACDVLTVSASLAHPAVTVTQDASTLGTAPALAEVSPLTARATTLAWSGSTASGYTAAFQWKIDGADACQSAYAPATCDDTLGTFTIPAGTLVPGTDVSVGLAVTLTPDPTAPCANPQAVALTLHPVTVSADLGVSPAAADIGGQITFTASNVQGSFTSLRVAFGTGAQTCTGQAGALFPDVASGTAVTATFATPGTFQATLYGTTGGLELPLSTDTYTVNAAGQCALPVAIGVSPTTVSSGSSATLTFNPPITGFPADTVTIAWGDGQTSAYSGAVWTLAPTLSSYSHAYTNTGSSAVTRTITVTGTVGGVPLAPTPTSLAVTVNPGTAPPPSSGNLTMYVSPSSPTAGSPATFSFSPAVSASGDSLTFNFGDGQSQVVTPTCGGSDIFGGPTTCTPTSQVVHTYATSGTKSVTVNGTISSTTYTASRTVTVASGCTAATAPSAAFSAPGEVQVGQTVAFTDGSAGGPTSWSWTFGDGIGGILGGGSSNLQNPTYAYAAAGQFTVTLTVSNCKGSSSTTRSVTVKPACSEAAAPTAAFDWSPKGTIDFHGVQQQQPFVGQQVTLVDQSTNNPTSWHWYDFQVVPGASFTTANPTFTWDSPGDKNVRLQATNCKGTSAELVRKVTIYSDVRPVLADFTWQAGGGSGAVTTGSVVTFTAASGFDYGSPTEFVWAFGDGESSAGTTVTHTYTCRGTFAVTLVAHRGSFTSEPVSKDIEVDGDACGPEALIASGAAKTAGLNGTSWRTTMWVFNPASEATMVWLGILPADTATANPPEVGPFTLAPGATQIIDDVVGLFSALPGLTTDLSKAAIKVRYANTSDTPPVVMSRTFTDAVGGGTYGQYIPGVPVVPNSTPTPLWLTGLHDDGTGATGFRTNLGITNLHAESPGTITLSLVKPSGETVATKSFGLGPYQYFQKSVGSVFGADYAAIGGLSVRVDLPARADVQAYASEVDNQTGDPVLLTATTPPTTPVLLPAVAHNPGELGTVWRSDAEVTNVDTVQHVWQLTLYPSGGTTGASRTVTLGAGQTADLSDLIGWLYGGEAPDISGLVRVESVDGSGVMPIVRARTYNLTPSGEFGQNIPALAQGGGASSSGTNRHLLLTGMSSEDVARTNLGFVNLGATTVNFAVTFYGRDGHVLNPDGRPYTVAVPPNGWAQQKLETRFAGFFQSQLGANLEGISASIDVTTGTGFAYASVVDNVTGDPIFVPAQPAP